MDLWLLFPTFQECSCFDRLEHEDTDLSLRYKVLKCTNLSDSCTVFGQAVYEESSILAYRIKTELQEDSACFVIHIRPFVCSPPSIPSFLKRLISYLAKYEWIKEELSLLGLAHAMQHDPYVINLLESRSSFFQWDLSSLFSCETWQMGHSESDRPLLCSSADNYFTQMSAETLTGTRRGSELWNHIQQTESFVPQLSACHIPSQQQLSAPSSQPSSRETAHTMGKGEDWRPTWSWLRAFHCKKFSEEEKSMSFCDYSVIKIWELEQRCEGTWGFLSCCSSFTVILQLKIGFYYLLTRDVTLGSYYLNLIFLNRNIWLYWFASRRTS